MLYQSNDLSLSRGQLFALINRAGLVGSIVPDNAEVRIIDGDFIHVRWGAALELDGEAA